MPRALLALLALLLLAAHAEAQTPTLPRGLDAYFGQDKPTVGAFTSVPAGGRAAAARAAFDGGIRLSTVGLESFEAPAFTAQNNNNKRQTLNVSFQGSGTSQTTRATIGGTFTGTAADQYTIRNDGQNATFATHGTQYLGSEKGYIEVNFSVPVSAFGFYGTDFGEGSTVGLRITMYEVGGAVRTLQYDGVDGPSGGALFFGFTDQERQYTRVDIQSIDAQGGDSSEYFGFDSFIVADVNQVAGSEFAGGSGAAVEGETVRLLLRLNETQHPNGGTVDVVLAGGTGSAADLDGFQTVAAAVDPGQVPAGSPGAGQDYNLVAVPVHLTLDRVPDDGETFVFELRNGTGGFAGRDGEAYTLTVGDPLPGFVQSFTPSPAVQGRPTTYTLTVNNAGNGRAAANLGFSAALPSGVSLASPHGAASTCGGTVTASGTSVTFAGGSVGADAACAVTVDVVSSAVADFPFAPVFLAGDRGTSQADAVALGVRRGVTLALAAPSAQEGGAATLTATLTSAAPAGGHTVDVALVAGDAADLGGFATQTLTFAAGQTTATASAAVSDDGKTEGAETFRFALQNPSADLVLAAPSTADLAVAASGPRAAFAAGAGQTAGASAVAASAAEGEQVAVTVALSDGAAGGEAVDVALASGDPADLGNYTTRTVTFAAGETSKTVTVSVTADGAAEPAETFSFALQNAQGGLSLAAVHAFDLTVGASSPGASFAAATATAAEGGSLAITLQLAAAAVGTESVEVVLETGAPTTGSAADLGGFTAQTVTFAAGETTRTLAVPVTADRQAEGAETFRFTLRGTTDPAGHVALDATVAPSHAGAAFAPAALAAAEGEAAVVTVALAGPALGGEAVDVALASGDPVDLGGYATRTVTFAAGETSASFEVLVSKDDVADQGERFEFRLQNAVRLDLEAPTTLDLVVTADSPLKDVVTVPPATVDDGGAEKGGPRYLTVPVAGVTAAEVAAAAANGGPVPTVYVLDPATGGLVPAAPDAVFEAGQAVYVDVAPGATLTFAGTAPKGPVTFAAAPAGPDGAVPVAVGNPAGEPVLLSSLRVEGGTLADVVLVLDPATGTFRPVSLSSLASGTDVLPAFGTVVVRVIPDGEGGGVRVTLDPAAADAGLRGVASGLSADHCEPGGTGETVVCLALGASGSVAAGDRAVVRLRPPADDVRGPAEALDAYDGVDVASPGAMGLAFPAGPSGALPLAALSAPFRLGTTATFPLDLSVDAPGRYELALARAVEAFAGQDLEVFLLDGATETPLVMGQRYAFEAASAGDVRGRFALRIGQRGQNGGPLVLDRVGLPFPNPAAGRTAFEFAVSEAQPVRVAVYDAIGREVLVALDGDVQPNALVRVDIDGARLATGLYVVRVEGRTVREARRFTVAR